LVGLGNPGAQYRDTRHNVGAWFVDRLVANNGLNWHYHKKFTGYQAKGHDADKQLLIFKPWVYMNQSGQSIAAVANYFKIEPQSIMIVHDELDFLPGKLAYKENGGLGGHNGLKDIAERIGSRQFSRLRIGIGHPGKSSQVISYVLSKPNQDDKICILRAIDHCLQILPELLSSQREQAIKQLHTRSN
jgi:PTH1 family peptidyl-tRNA hydrolase